MTLKQINFKVSGMTIQGGILWSGWPDDVRSALEKREEVVSTHFDDATRIFGMTYDPDNYPLEDIKDTIDELGKSRNMPYSMEIVEL